MQLTAQTSGDRLYAALEYLTQPQQDFALALSIHGSVPAASREVGICTATGYKMQSLPWVDAFIRLTKIVRQETALVTVAEMEYRLDVIATVDMRSYWREEVIAEWIDDDGELVQKKSQTLKPMSELTYKQAQCIQAIDYDKQQIKLLSVLEANRDIAKLNHMHDPDIVNVIVPVTEVNFVARPKAEVPAEFLNDDH